MDYRKIMQWFVLGFVVGFIFGIAARDAAAFEDVQGPIRPGVPATSFTLSLTVGVQYADGATSETTFQALELTAAEWADFTETNQLSTQEQVLLGTGVLTEAQVLALHNQEVQARMWVNIQDHLRRVLEVFGKRQWKECLR